MIDMSALIGFFVLVGAVSLGLLERAMGPDMKRFPCVDDLTIWALRVYALSLAATAFNRIYMSSIGQPLDWNEWQLQAAFSMAFAHSVLAWQVLRQPLPNGMYAKLGARWQRARRGARVGGRAGEQLATIAVVGPVPSVVAPESTLPSDLDFVGDGLLERLANRP